MLASMDMHASHRWISAFTLALVALSGTPAFAAGADGMICIAAFHVEAQVPGKIVIPEVNMSETTWPPSHDSKFKFSVDGRLRATVGNDEMGQISGLSTGRRVRIKVSLDGRPYEAFSLDLGKAPGHRICLWLYTDYWHWIDHGWDKSLGCKCH
ncbi:MAG TPA: hypothetical protein VH394_07865 [Thermoanaerobaculia bacterium]|nr:hypothetical protein [Thermoanaerobaculia bacterium]